MTYSIHGQISCRKKIELGILGPSVIKPSCSVYSSACSEYTGTNSSFGRNYWGKYGPFVLFAITVNKSVAFIFLITSFLQRAHMYSISTLSYFQVINSTRSWVILLQTFLKGTFDFMLQGLYQTESRNFINTRVIIDFNDLVIIIINHHHLKNDMTLYTTEIIHLLPFFNPCITAFRWPIIYLLPLY